MMRTAFHPKRLLHLLLLLGVLLLSPGITFADGEDGAEVFQHAARHAFASGDVASQTDHEFTVPIAQGISSLLRKSDVPLYFNVFS